MEIKPYPLNAKKHSKSQIDAIAKSIKEFGFNQPIVVDKKGFIIVGHGRSEASKLLGIKNPPFVVANLTDAKAKAYRLADNKLNESDWDMDLVLKELETLGAELVELTGFSKDLVVVQDEEDDIVPEIPKKPQSKRGDIYTLGSHIVMCGDSTIEDDVKKLMSNQRADMIFTDPPYGIKMSRSLVSGKDNSIKNDSLDEKGMQSLLGSSLGHAVSYSNLGAPLYLWIGFRAYSLAEAIVKKHFKISNCIVWKKPSIGLGGAGYRLQHELCIFSGKIKDRTESDVWEFKRDTARLHPTTKPIDLVVKAIVNSSAENNLILDPFLGSGSTLIAAEKTGRTCYGIELDPKYVDVIVQRYVNYVENAIVIKNGKKISWEKTK